MQEIQTWYQKKQLMKSRQIIILSKLLIIFPHQEGTFPKETNSKENSMEKRKNQSEQQLAIGKHQKLQKNRKTHKETKELKTHNSKIHKR